MKKFAIVAMTALMVVGVGCSKKTTGTNSSASSLGATQLYQPPQVSGTVTNMSNNSVMMNVNTLTGASNLSKPAVAPATVNLDLSGSKAPSGGALSAVVKVNGIPVSPVSGMKYSMSFSKPGAQAVQIVLSDSLGLSSTTNFQIPVSCDPASYPAIALNMAGLSITAPGAGGAGYVNVSAPAATGGSGLGSFQYAIDLNGDGRFDDYQNLYWNNSSSWSNMYTLYNGSRTVSVTVYDTGCQFEKTFTKVVDFSSILPAKQSGANATQQPYMYIQGNVASLSGSSDLAEAVSPFDSMDEGLPNMPKHVLASYPLTQKSGSALFDGNFTLSGSNIYSDGNASSSAENLLKQNMQLAFVLHNDTGAIGTQTFSNVPLTNLNYQTASSPDGNLQQYTYNMDSACSANVTLIRTAAAAPCATGSGVMSPAVIVLGTFSCPHLSSSLADSPSVRAISITNGYFYVPISVSDNCAGGQGQGGGQPPPSF